MTSPFRVLELEPTTDLARVKQAYFAQLAKHPPHADPEGFRRLRHAYESLTRPGGLTAAYAQAPVDVKQELERYNQAWEPRIQTAAQRLRSLDAGSRVAEILSSMSLKQALERWGRTQR